MPAELLRTPIDGVVELISQPFCDSRGAFFNLFRSYEEAFIEAWGHRSIAQVNLSRNDNIGTIRGLHLQAKPCGEAKLVRCLKGKVWDVAVDLRPDSDTNRQWQAVELTPERGNALLIPEGCAHGFQVLESGSELLYLHSGAWLPDMEIGVRWDDPQLAVAWPITPTEISSRDLGMPLLSEIFPVL